jgi:hypothetical protein
MTNAVIYNDLVSYENPQKHTWQDSSVCAQTDPEVFFPQKGSSYTIAKKFCDSCLVRSNCLEKAMEDEGSAHRHDRFGMSGGLTPGQRYKLYLEQNGLEELEDEIESQIAA